MNKIQVSVIIPVYNVEQYLRQCLDSVCNQTFKDIEIIIVNDCSPDNSLEIIKEYQRKDERIVLVDLKQNVGLGFARNEGMKVAKGKYITFVDSDDWIANNYVEVLYNTIRKSNSVFVCSEYWYYNNISREVTKGIAYSNVYDTVINSISYKKQLIQNLSFCRAWTTIYEKDFLFSNDIYFKVTKFEDTLFLYELIVKSSGVLFIKDRLYYYRVNRGNSITNNYIIDNKILSYGKIKKLNDNNIFKEYIPEFYTFISLDMAIILDNPKLPFKDLTRGFFKFREMFYDKKYVVSFSNLKIRNKIRLFVFKICLKCNFNYCYIGLIHSKFNPIRLFTKR